jgi:hypothetical protein
MRPLNRSFAASMKGRMQTLFCLVFLLSMTSLASAEQPGRNATNDFTGTYVMDQGDKAGGTLMVLYLPENKLKFELECHRGAPSYNSGEASGIIAVRNAAGMFRTTEFGGECEITFAFQKSGVTISQNGSDSDCGFGFGVRCDGHYRLKSRKQPMLSAD